jgi:K+-transporting ATPase A subunit
MYIYTNICIYTIPLHVTFQTTSIATRTAKRQSPIFYEMPFWKENNDIIDDGYFFSQYFYDTLYCVSVLIGSFLNN